MTSFSVNGKFLNIFFKMKNFFIQINNYNIILILSFRDNSGVLTGKNLYIQNLNLISIKI